MYLARYPDELFRINRRRFGNLGMVFYRVLELGIAHSLVSYEDFLVSGQPQAVPPHRCKRVDSLRVSSAPLEPPVENCLPGFLRLNGYPIHVL